MRIITIVARIPVHITGSQVKPLEFSYIPWSPAGGGHGIALVDFVKFIVLNLTAPWHPEMQFIIRMIVV
jgi:hypothetical protein